MLVNDHPSEGFYSVRDPDGILDREDQFSRFGRGLVTYPIVGRFGIRKNVVGRVLAPERRSDKKKGQKVSIHDSFEIVYSEQLVQDLLIACE